jgi:hypothetical protein
MVLGLEPGFKFCLRDCGAQTILEFLIPWSAVNGRDGKARRMGAGRGIVDGGDCEKRVVVTYDQSEHCY